MNRPIAIFDSGVGGFTVVKDIMRQLPYETIVYMGDTARAPYGNRTAEEIISFSEEICDYLMQFNPKLIVIACNTATALAIDTLRSKFNIPIIGVIESAVKTAVASSRHGKIGVIGTEATIRSGAYEKTIKSVSSTMEVFSHACPLFVPLVEQGQYLEERTFYIVDEQLSDIKQANVASLILGCTHYPFLKSYIQRAVGSDVNLIHSGLETAKAVKAMIVALTTEQRIDYSQNGDSHLFICTAKPELFQAIGKQWLSHQLHGQSCIWKVTEKIVW